MATPSPFPSFSPHSATDVQQLQLLHQIQNHDMSPLNALILAILLKFPLPDAIFSLQQRLDLFTSISAHSPSANSTINFSPLAFTSLIIFWPLYIMIGLTLGYFIIKGLIAFISNIAPGFVGKFLPQPPKTYLEVTFPSDTSKSAYATSQLYTLLHNLARRNTFWGGLLKQKKTYSLEIVSSKDKGIRYILVTNPNDADVFKSSLLSYLPGIKIKEIEDYLGDTPESFKADSYGIVELKLSSHFALPLNKQKTLEEHDPISYLTGSMTRLDSGELISFQVVATPVLNSLHSNFVKRMNDLRHRMYRGEPLTPILQEGVFTKISSLPGIIVFAFLINVLLKIFKGVVVFIWSMFLGLIDPNSKTIPFLMTADAINNIKTQELLNPYEQELQKLVKEKIDQNLFETSIRLLVVAKDPGEVERRFAGILASFGQMSSPYQTIKTKSSLFSFRGAKKRFVQLKQRTLSKSSSFNQNPILSTSEISDLYHFPYANTTKTEDMVKLHSRELPAPLSLKRDDKFDVTFAKNTYGGEDTLIGLTREERRRHMYVLGATGTGKSTLILSMINSDLENGEGLCVVDPHGELAEAVLGYIPKNRINDVIYFNPDDLEHPIALNLMELTPGLNPNDALREKEFLAESIVSLFRKVFGESISGNPHRIEYILRNTIHTAFTIPNATLFTIYDLLNDPDYRKQAIKGVSDKRLQQFWKNEFSKAGNWQQVKMISPVTARIGRFLFSPSAKRILEQEKSTINFDQIMDSGKILICNLSKGNLGEDTAQVLGITILNKIQLAALKRSKIPAEKRKDFYLYVDEFQHFATQSFIGMLSEARKYKLNIAIAEQSTSQQNDRNLVNVILANVGTTVMFKSANPEDEERILPQFSPYVKKGEILNLPAYHFYIKIGALNPEESFSGETVPVEVDKDASRIKKVIQASQKRYSNIYVNKDKEQPAIQNEPVEESNENPKRKPKKAIQKTFIPDDEEEFAVGTRTN